MNQLPPEPVTSFKRDSKGNQWLSMILSRGCPLRCRFCSNFLTQGRTFRCTPIEKLKTVLENIPANKDAAIHINLEDDNLLVKKSYFSQCLLMMKEIFPRSTFSIENGLDYTNMSLQYIDFLIETGFTSFTLSLGSSDIKTLKEEKRPANLLKLERTLDYLKKTNLPVTTFLICGLPEDTPETIVSSLVYLHKLPTDIGISLFYPVPGLPLFEEKKIFLEKSPRLCCGSSAYPWSGSLSSCQMITAFRLARLSNLMNKKEKTPEELKLIEVIKTTGRFHSFQGKKKEIIEIPLLDDYLLRSFFSEAFN
jgi:radical SAM superfamily enzyme YgiQ (UPF0313 family)